MRLVMIDIATFKKRTEVVVTPPVDATPDSPGHEGFLVTYDGNALSLADFINVKDLVDKAESGGHLDAGKIMVDFLIQVEMQWNLGSGGVPIPTDDPDALLAFKPGYLVMRAGNAIMANMQYAPKDTPVSVNG